MPKDLNLTVTKVASSKKVVRYKCYKSPYRANRLRQMSSIAKQYFVTSIMKIVINIIYEGNGLSAMQIGS